MSIAEKTFFAIKCDSCGTETDYFATPATAENEAQTYMDWEKYNDNHYCPDCWEYDDDGEVKLKQKEL